MPFGDRLKEFREANGYTQDELAKMVGVAKTTITGYERGNRTPDVEKIKKLAKALGITGDDLLETGLGNKKAPSISDEAMNIAKRYHNLDSYGKATVRAVIDEEENRMEDEARFKEETAAPDFGQKVINLFVEPSAAGIAAPTFGRDYEPYELKDSDPQGAAYAVRIQGDSMEPYIKDGSIVFVNHDALADGDIGIFCVDGGTVCKQYHKEGGVIYLLSLNRARSDADVVILPSSNQTLVCQGRVITKKRIPVPEVTL